MLEQQEATPSLRRVACKTVLIVEDDTATAELFALILSETPPYRPLVVSSLGESLRVAHSSQPDLLLLAYYVPTMTVLDLYYQFHAREEFARTPILLMSTAPLSDEEEQEMNAHQIRFLRKPFDLDVFLETIEHLVS
jgi:CheY-like chemotaxis protein